MNFELQFTSCSISDVLLLTLFVIMCGIQLFYYFKYFLPLSQFSPSTTRIQTNGVSIIIAAKNEEAHMNHLLKTLVAQHYPKFEIIVVNDYSEDGTLSVLQNFVSKKLLVVNNTKQPGKKSAISQGIEAASFDNLLFTDADCLPNSKNWISIMSGHFSKDTEIVLGFGAFKKHSGILNGLIRFEGFIGAVQYFGFALAGKAYMGVGRNLAYKKSTFKSMGGFAGHQDLLSGDDDLLINKAANSSNVSIELDEAAHTSSEAEKKWKHYVRQKRRQLSAGAYYKLADKIRLAIFGASSFLYYALFVTLLLIAPFKPLILGIFVVKQFLEYLLLKRIAKRLKVEDLMPFVSILEPLYIISMTAMGVSTWFWKVKQWK